MLTSDAVLHLIVCSFDITVKAGGMRIVQHKAPAAERAPKDAEDCTGLTVSNMSPVFFLSIHHSIYLNQQPVAVNSGSVSGAPVKGNTDFTPASAQVAHSHKPPAAVQQKPLNHIQQPRK
ncbi:hypothetical protein KR038_003763 [Drosophila bunnanda]|nr:hypothetical protein KR038_003763 [Drosophila bunnanda]